MFRRAKLMLDAVPLDVICAATRTASKLFGRDYDCGHAFYEATGWRLDGGARDEGRQVRYRRSLRHAPWVISL